MDTDLSLEDLLAETILEHIEVDESITHEEISLELVNENDPTFTYLATVRGKVLGEEVIQEFTAQIKVKRSVCPECSKYASGYYEAVIQLRADERYPSSDEIETADKIIQNRLERLSKDNRMAYISQRALIKEGVDYYVGSYKAARKLTDALKNVLGGVVKESPRLMGRDKHSGKDLYRIWISLRMPHFFRGDFTSFDNIIAEISNYDGNKIYLKNLESLQRVTVPWRDMDKLKVIAHKDDIKKVLVSAITPKQIQILHPETYQPMDIDMTSQFSQVKIGEEIDVVEINGVFYLLMDEKKI
jgi:nonsense-mediated mRNA decay protein 3